MSGTERELRQAMACLTCGLAGETPRDHFPQPPGLWDRPCPGCGAMTVWVTEPNWDAGDQGDRTMSGTPAREEFEAAYAARSGVTVEFLHSEGMHAEPCDCGEPECEGWAMGRQWEDAIVENQLRERRRDH